MRLLCLFFINLLLWINCRNPGGKIFPQNEVEIQGTVFSGIKENRFLNHGKNSSHAGEKNKEELKIDESKVPFRAIEEIYNNMFRELKFREKSQTTKSQVVTTKCYVNDVYQLVCSKQQ